MALPINIEDLLNKQKVEDNRIEFKRGWNPDKIYHTICAFATDLDNTGGGYILVGVEQDENGIAKRPVKGLPIDTIDDIMKDWLDMMQKLLHPILDRFRITRVSQRRRLMVRPYLLYGFRRDQIDLIVSPKVLSPKGSLHLNIIYGAKLPPLKQEERHWMKCAP